jgi:hypothetical protein
MAKKWRSAFFDPGESAGVEWLTVPGVVLSV